VLISELVDICGGITMSRGRQRGTNPVFEGDWFDDVSNQVVADQQLLFFSDAPFSMDDKDVDDWLEWLDDLKWWCQTVFHQDIVWMTLNPVSRITYKDYQQDWEFRDTTDP
jgi:hypothetical protein